MDATHSPPTGVSGPEIEVRSYADLARLPDALDDLSRQMGDIVAHARRWVCSTEGFEPSPVCVLRPLVPVLHHLADAFADVEARLSRELAEVGAALATSHDGLQDADTAARTALAGRVPTC